MKQVKTTPATDKHEFTQEENKQAENEKWFLTGNIPDENGDWLIANQSSMDDIIAKASTEDFAEIICKAVNERQALLDALGDLIDYLGKDWKDDEEVKKAKLIFNNAKNI